MRVLVFGGSGQLGTTLRKTCPVSTASFLDRSGADLTKPTEIEDAVLAFNPSVVINAAAYTAVERAESDPVSAFAINADAVGALGKCCAKVGARIIHVSTDYVFDGRSYHAYTPNDAPNPINVYGASKLAGEQELGAIDGLCHLIIRTSWLYSESGSSFLVALLKQASQRRELRVVCDQRGTPTSAWSLARCLWRAAELNSVVGVEHFSDGTALSWYEFAIAILEEASSADVFRGPVSISPVATADYSATALRPSFSALDSSDTYSKLAIAAPDWRNELRAVIQRYKRLS